MNCLSSMALFDFVNQSSPYDTDFWEVFGNVV